MNLQKIPHFPWKVMKVAATVASKKRPFYRSRIMLIMHNRTIPIVFSSFANLRPYGVHFESYNTASSSNHEPKP
jgi:hypothetical protein